MNIRLYFVIALLSPWLSLGNLSFGQVYERIYTTAGSGYNPLAPLTLGPDGIFYGTTASTVFRLNADRSITTLAQFNNATGRISLSPLLYKSDGKFYGTTASGGSQGNGAVFSVTRAGDLTALASFPAAIGVEPLGRLVEAPDGNLYGTTRQGGINGVGAIFKVTMPAGTLSKIADFSRTSLGAHPVGGLLLAPDGKMYGATEEGGQNDMGAIYSVTTGGVITRLASFAGANGRKPGGGVVLGRDGNFYGVTRQGGADYVAAGFQGSGTFYRVTPAGALTRAATFGASAATAPVGEPLLVEDGSFYGMTIGSGSGSFRYGGIYRVMGSALSMSGEFLSAATGWFADRSAADARYGHHFSSLVAGVDGGLYGTTVVGGNGFQNESEPGFGAVFRLPQPQAFSGSIEVASSRLTVAATSSFNVGDFIAGPGLPRGARVVVVQDENNLLLSDFATATVSGQFSLSKGPAAVASFTEGGLGEIVGEPYIDGDGTLYGVATDAVFQLSATGTYRRLASFIDPSYPTLDYNTGGVAKGSDGVFYVVNQRIAPLGGIYRLSGGFLDRITTFDSVTSAAQGSVPNPYLTLGDDGYLYGTTQRGGSADAGTLFSISPDGAFASLASFGGGAAGSQPVGRLLKWTDGNFYGLTSAGGVGDTGTMCRIVPPATPGGTATIQVLRNFSPSANGAAPRAGLVLGSDNNFWGTTSAGGANDLGACFSMTPNGATYVRKSSFVPAVGDTPHSSLTLGPDGHYYGTVLSTSTMGLAAIFKLTSDTSALTVVQPFVADPFAAATKNGLVRSPNGNLYGSVPNAIYQLSFTGAPVATTEEATNITTGGGLAVAKVNARGLSTRITIEYGSDGVNFPNTVDTMPGVLTDHVTTPVFAALAVGLEGATRYFRVRATNSAGTTVGATRVLATYAYATAAIAPATSVTASSARFNGTINARNFATTAVFEWGTEPSNLPTSVPISPAVVTGNVDVAVQATVFPLPIGKTIYYRLRAKNAAGDTISNVASFSTVSVTTTAPGHGDIGVTDAVFRATVNTFGRIANVKFKYWATTAPGTILETATQIVVSNSPVAVSHVEPGLLENVSYAYRVSVELEGTETDGEVVTFTTDENEPPMAQPDLVFYAGQVEFDPLANDTDANNLPPQPANRGLRVAANLVEAPAASRAVAGVSSDGLRVSYNPQFNVREDDALTYRVVDPLGATADTQVRLIAFSKRAGLYNGKIVFGSGASAREGQVAVQMGSGGAISTSFMAWPNTGEGVRESFVLKGEFDQQGTLNRTLNSPSGAVLTLTLRLDPDAPQMFGTFEERVNDVSTTGEVAFVLLKNGGTGGLAESGLRTGFLHPPAELAGVMTDGFVRMTIGKDARRGARFAGRLPDGEPFLASAKAQGRTYELTRKLEQGGMFTGLVRAIDASGMMANLYWGKQPSGKARFHRGGVESMLALSGVAYPVIPRGALPPLGLNSTSPNARLRLSGGDLNGTYRDLLLNILPGGVQIVGPDNLQVGAGLKTLNTNKMTIKLDAPQAKFTGKFLHPETGQSVTFEGAFRASFDAEPSQGRGIFRGPTVAGAVRIEAN